MHTRLRRLFVICLLAGWGVVDSAEAADKWSTPHPGVRHLERTTNAPNRIDATIIDLCHRDVSLRATRPSERGRTVSSFGRHVGADVAVNGDFFEGNYEPIGLAVGDGRSWPGTSDGSRHGFIAFGNHKTEVSNPPVSVGSPPNWVDDAVGGNILVVHNGNVTNDTGSFCTNRHPRTAAGISKDGQKLILAVVDGRSSRSRGMRCDELGRLMKGLGAHQAINLDGGGSTAMWLRNKGVVNSPSDGQQRIVANHLAVHAGGGPAPPEACPEPPDFEVTARWDELDNFYRDGSSHHVPDVLVGETMTGEILVKNESPWKMPNLIAGYWIEHPFLKATDYTIYSDHPHYDRASWSVNSADSADENPPKDQLGREGFLTMHAFSHRETKRVEIEFAASRYSVGATDHPDLRTWIKRVPYIYGEQDAFDQQPTNANRVGRLLQDYTELDVLSRDEWQFDGGRDQREGWRRCSEELPELEVPTDPGVLRAPTSAGDTCLRSPDWTRIDADRFDELVIRARAEASTEMTAELGWRTEAGTSDTVRFEHTFSGDVQTLVVPVGDSPQWQGAAREITIAPSFREIGPGLDIDALFFQHRADQQTSSEREEVVAEPPVPPLESDDDGDTDEIGDTGITDTGTSGDRDGGSGDTFDDHADTGSSQSDIPSGDIGEADNRVETSGCACEHRPSRPPGGIVLILFLGIAGWGRRRLRDSWT